MKRTCVQALVVMTFCTLSAASRAQDYVFQGLASDIAQGMMLEANREAQMEIQEEPSGDARITAKKAATPALSAAALSYQVSLARRKANLRNFVEKSRAADPEGAAKLEQMFASADVIAQIGQALAPYGLKITNVADAYAFWMMNAWMGANGVNFDPTPKQISAVKSQVARALLSSRGFADANDALKQNMAEALLIQGAMAGAALEDPRYQSGAGRISLIQTMKKAGQSMNIDFTAITLTETGFAPRKGG